MSQESDDLVMSQEEEKKQLVYPEQIAYPVVKKRDVKNIKVADFDP